MAVSRATPQAARQGRGIAVAGGISLLYFLLLLRFFAPAASSPDANGYLTQARLLAESGRTFFQAESPLQYAGGHWIELGGRFFSRYPPGLPAAEAAAFRLSGIKGALLLNPLFTSLSLLAVYLITGKWAGGRWGFVAMAVMAFNPIANVFALTGDSHAATSFLLVWGVWALAKWSDRGDPYWGFAAGFLFGAIPSVRYPEALFGAGVALFLALHVCRRRGAEALQGSRRWSSLAAPCAGALLPLLLLAVRNTMDFGSPLRTGYSLTGEESAFSLAYLGPHSVLYMKNLLAEGAGVFGALGPIAIIVLIARTESRRQGILLAALAAPITLLYMSYYFAPAEMPQATMRFLLPTFYLYAIAGVWLLRILSDARIPGVRAVTAAVTLGTVWWGLPQSLLPLEMFRRQNGWLAETTRMVSADVPPQSILIAPEEISQHLDTVGRWRLAGEELLSGTPQFPPAFAGAAESGGAPNPMDHARERRRILIERFGSEGPELSPALLRELDRWAGPAGEIYWIGPMEQIRRRVPEGDRVEELAGLPSRPDPIAPPGAAPRQQGFAPGGGPPGSGMRSPGSGPPGMGVPGFRFPGARGGRLFLAKWTRQR